MTTSAIITEFPQYVESAEKVEITMRNPRGGEVESVSVRRGREAAAILAFCNQHCLSITDVEVNMESEEYTGLVL